MKDDRFLLKVKDLETNFFSKEGTVKAVDRVSFNIKDGETLGIAGESGCGKSVTAKSILRLIPKNGRIVDGSIILKLNGDFVDLTSLDPFGKEIRAIRGKIISMIFQEPMTSFSMNYTIGNQIMEVVRLHQKCSIREARERTLKMLKMVRMPAAEKVIDEYPFNISGGMRQRAMIAMALSCNPKLLIADEPTTALDVTIQAQILDLMKRMQKKFNMALIIITHDLGVISETCDNALIMYLGEVLEYASTEELFNNPKNPYTKDLLKSVPKLGRGSNQKLETIKGAVPSLYEKPGGCPFHPRCSSFMPGVCNKKRPEVVEVNPGHRVSCFLYK